MAEFTQKYLSGGPKLVRELFHIVEERAPGVVFFDEIYAIGTKRYVRVLLGCIHWSDTPARYYLTSDGKRKTQRTMLELN